MGRFAGAVAAYRKVIEADPDSATAHLNLGDALFRQKRYSHARASYTRAAELDPKLARPHENLALIQYHFRKFDEALAEVEACEALGRKVNPDFVEALKQAAARRKANDAPTGEN